MLFSPTPCTGGLISTHLNPFCAIPNTTIIINQKPIWSTEHQMFALYRSLVSLKLVTNNCQICSVLAGLWKRLHNWVTNFYNIEAQLILYFLLESISHLLFLYYSLFFLFTNLLKWNNQVRLFFCLFSYYNVIVSLWLRLVLSGTQ